MHFWDFLVFEFLYKHNDYATQFNPNVVPASKIGMEYLANVFPAGVIGLKNIPKVVLAATMTGIAWEASLGRKAWPDKAGNANS